MIGRGLRAFLTVGFLLGSVGCVSQPPALAAWHLDASFGSHGVAGVPVREEGVDFPNVPGPGDRGSLLAQGPQGSVFVGGYARSRRGAFLLARLSAQGRLVRSFGNGGVTVVPAIYATPRSPPRMLAVSAGRLLVVGLDRAHHLVVVRLSARGHPDRTFGHAGVARYPLAHAGAHAILAAAVLESDGDVLVVYYGREVPQPVNEPMIQPGLGEGPVEMTRLSPSGALDRSFGSGGFLQAGGPSPVSAEESACGVTAVPDGSVLLAYEQAVGPSGPALEGPAVQELDPGGANAPGFGDRGTAFIAGLPRLEGVSSSLFGALFALSGGRVQASFGGGGALYRFTPSGIPDTTFAASGHTSGGSPVLDIALAPDGETFAVGASRALRIRATLPDGSPDPALGGAGGERFPVELPQQSPQAEQQVVEELAQDGSLLVLVGEDLFRVVR